LSRIFALFRTHYRDVIIRIADLNDPFTVIDVGKNGFVDNRHRHPNFVETFWRDMVDKLDIEVDDSVDGYVRRPSFDIVLIVKP
jgi:hypothetical protein